MSTDQITTATSSEEGLFDRLEPHNPGLFRGNDLNLLPAVRGYPKSYAAFGRGYLNGMAGLFLSGASRRNIPRIELIRTQASPDSGVLS